MGVLNVTPDSFSDGGLWLDPDLAVKHGLRMVEQGADIIDVGGESTRPGAEAVSAEEEASRVLPVIERLAGSTDALVSIDTRKPQVAQAAVDAGAVIVNDTAGEDSDEAMDQVALATGAGYIVMHSRGTPETMRELARYEDVVSEVARFLAARAASLVASGMPRDAICLDPGFGFAKAPVQNLEMLRRFDEFVALGYPILAGTSRKSFIGEVLDLPPDRRLEGTLATVVWSVAKGAAIVRVHDVEETVRAVKMVDAIVSGEI